MRVLAFVEGKQDVGVLQEVSTVFADEDIVTFEDWAELERILPALDEDIVLLDCGRLPFGPDANDILRQSLETFRSAQADLLVMVDQRGDELSFLKIFRPGIWRQVLGGSRGGNTILVSADLGCGDDYDRRRHLEEAEAYRDRIGDRLFHPERVSGETKHLVRDDVQRTQVVLSIPAAGKVLDVGCSDGSITIEWARMWGCKEIVGIDIASSAVREARIRLENLEVQCNISFVEAFVEELAFPEGSFDTIVATETLEHLGRGQLEHAMRNLVRMLSAEGNMIVSVPNRYPHPRYEREGRARWRWPSHHHFFTRYGLECALRCHFEHIEFLSLYPEDSVEQSIYLIANCRGKRFLGEWFW